MEQRGNGEYRSPHAQDDLTVAGRRVSSQGLTLGYDLVPALNPLGTPLFMTPNTARDVAPRAVEDFEVRKAADISLSRMQPSTLQLLCFHARVMASLMRLQVDSSLKGLRSSGLNGHRMLNASLLGINECILFLAVRPVTITELHSASPFI